MAAASGEASAGETEQAKGKPRESMVQAIAAFAVLTLVAAGSGTFLGFHLVGSVETAMKTKAAENPPTGPEPRYASGTRMVSVPPIVANLASPENVWVRLESSIIFAEDDIPHPDVLAGQIAQDILAYLRTLTLEQIEGPSGLLHLHEDLNDRVSIRSDHRVRELVVETLVVQ